jgi:hypothetical protein
MVYEPPRRIEEYRVSLPVDVSRATVMYCVFRWLEWPDSPWQRNVSIFGF